jgi:dihydropteroate synthase
MQDNTAYQDILAEITGYLEESITLARNAGVPAENLAVDPGIGFGKSVEGNLEILRRLGELGRLGRPILLGTSRKSFLGSLLEQDDPEQRLSGSLATIALGVAAGAMIFRVHDVQASREAARVAMAIVRA